MNIIFMGTPDFAGEILSGLLKSEEHIISVYTGLDKERKRGHKLLPTPVKIIAENAEIPVYQPTTLRSKAVAEEIRNQNPDLIIVAAYGKILPKEILDIPRFGCINVHASLLPKYRGAAPIQWAVLSGDSETGITIMQMAEGLDNGDILHVKKTDIFQNETSGELFERLAKLGSQALLEAIELLKADNLKAVPQDESKATYAKMITKEMSKINWNEDASKIRNNVYGLQPWPATKAVLHGNEIKILGAEAVPDMGLSTGQIKATDKEIFVGCKGSTLKINILQKSGKSKTTAKEFLCGTKIDENTFFE